MKEGQKIIVAVSGASGAIYARLLVERLCAVEGVENISLIFSYNGLKVAEYEGHIIDTSHKRITVYDNHDMFASPASGSADYDAMVVVPCSMGCVGRIASGVSTDLISRAADVMLKERAKLVIVPRETPMNTIHLRNLTTLSECGAVIIPACPSFYALPDSIEGLCMSVVERIIRHLGLDDTRFSWGKS